MSKTLFYGRKTSSFEGATSLRFKDLPPRRGSFLSVDNVLKQILDQGRPK